MLMLVLAGADASDSDTPAAGVIVQAEDDTVGRKSGPSPWLAVPMISSDPKVGTSAGGMVGYLFKLDPESTASMVGLGGTYSTTDSLLGGVFLRSFWDHDRKRLIFFGGGGNLKKAMKTFSALGSRYRPRIKCGWFRGVTLCR